MTGCLLIVGVFLLVLAFFGWIADSLDNPERRDALRRNGGRR